MLNGLGIFHEHLHPGNITFEWVKKDVTNLTNLEYDPKKISFDINEGLEHLNEYVPVVRGIDIQGIELKNNSPLQRYLK